MSDRAENKIMDSRGEQFSIEPVPKFDYGGLPFGLDGFTIRGQSALNFQRKSFSVNLSNGLVMSRKDNALSVFGKFKLISLVYDYTYIENRLSHLLLSELDLWPLCSFFTEVKINDHHQGLYLFVEDPESFLIQRKNADCVLRRYYRNEISSFKLDEGKRLAGSKTYIEKFQSIYTNDLANYQGNVLYDQLAKQMNIQNYMKKMAFDFIVRNGDFVDEIYFYAKEVNGSTYFDILPWDYDDLFSGSPHEIGRDWAVGTIFGVRTYSSALEVDQVLNGRLIFSVEDDLDYCIATDDYLYQQYLKEMKLVLSILTPNEIISIFDVLYDELLPFYQMDEILEQSNYDADPTSFDLFQINWNLRKNELVQRVEWINDQIVN